jgi:aminopeptidase
MHDPRLTRLADLLVNFSVKLQTGEHLLIETIDIPDAMTIELIRAAHRVGGHAHVATRSSRVLRAIDEAGDDACFEVWGAYDVERMKRMDAYIALRGSGNANENAGIDPDRMHAKGKHYMRPVHFTERINNTKWCVLRWPSSSMAQLSGVSTEAFEDFYFDVCTLDYAKMNDAATHLVARMNATDQVHILGPGDTDLTFSIKDIPAVPCCGEMNIPDGECFTAPVKDSINGVMHYNTPTIYHGHRFENVRLVFKDGKIVEATADRGGEHLDAIFDTDEGGRYVGEFAIGFNPHVKEAMMDILFDEKIDGSLHFTPGNAYAEAFNGNTSDIHWDMVLIQRPEYGGGTIAFDGEVIRKDGRFVVDDLMGLNPENLT